jgi:hypothetical protein
VRAVAESSRLTVPSGPTGLTLDAARASAGDAVTGRVADASAPVPVALMRVESRPRGQRAFTVARATTEGPDGAFVLAVPEHALPSATGTHCALSYRVQTGAGDALAQVPVEVSASAHPHLDDDDRWRIDRLIPNWDARHFHIELADAALHGGGRIAGRVHRHGAWRAGAMTLDVSCREAWRLPARTARAIPTWGGAWLWRHIARLEVDPDATWAPFDLRLPARLPPATEARTIAWRYEIVVRRRPRRGLTESAARTPLLHEEAALVRFEP